LQGRIEEKKKVHTFTFAERREKKRGFLPKGGSGTLEEKRQVVQKGGGGTETKCQQAGGKPAKLTSDMKGPPDRFAESESARSTEMRRGTLKQGSSVVAGK